MILVTGGAGFIGSNFVHEWLAAEGTPVVNLDKLTYAGNLDNLSAVRADARHVFVRGDICDRALVESLLQTHHPRAVVHFAAESHVDRSIDGPADFIRTNVMGTVTLLEAVRAYWSGLAADARASFRFLHVSTDEVYGSLRPSDPPFTETTPYAPNSPYAASKAGADHLVRAYHQTYGLPTITTNCSNNYGPYQFPEKLVPHVIVNALQARPIALHGDGSNVRDWLHVADHCEAIRAALAHAAPGETYNIGGNCERANIEVVTAICAIVDRLRPEHAPHARLITFVQDRPGNDRRYALDTGKIRRELGWQPRGAFEERLPSTVEWYAGNAAWVADVESSAYRGHTS